MRTFLLKEKSPIVKWGLIPPNTYFEGTLPEGYQLAISPGDDYIILDVDVNHKGGKNGFDNIPKEVLEEIEKTFNYSTKSGGKHYWFRYSGNKNLANKTSGMSFDLRVGDKGYVVYYPKEDIRNCIHLIQETSSEVNIWIETWFSFKH